VKRLTLRAGIGALLGVLAMGGLAVVPAHGQPAAAPPMIVRFLDVGFGDATWVTTPEQRTILVDCGPLSFGKDFAQALRSAGATHIDLLALSNAHPEAVGGCVEILRRIPVDTALVPAQLASSPAWKLFLAQLANTNTRVINAVAGSDPNPIGSVALHVLNPVDNGQSAPLDEYDDSTVLVLDYLGTRVLLAGDIHARGETQAHTAGLPLFAPFAVMRVPDHASSLSSSERFLNDVQAQYAVVSYALDPTTPAPDDATMARLRSSVGSVFTTAHDGTVVAQIDSFGRVQMNPPAPSAGGDLSLADY
jgi:beta-lactamase superfamily II metal-dependent hydrolase